MKDAISWKRMRRVTVTARKLFDEPVHRFAQAANDPEHPEKKTEQNPVLEVDTYKRDYNPKNAQERCVSPHKHT
jgi:hypothetical protein